MNLQDVFPNYLQQGILLRPDGVAVALINGGAPAWDLLGEVDQEQMVIAYHRLLLAQDGPLDVYTVDAPVNLNPHIEMVLDRQRDAVHERNDTAAAVLGVMADTFTDFATSGQCRAKRNIFIVSSEKGASVQNGNDLQKLQSLLSRDAKTTNAAAPKVKGAEQAAITAVLNRARRLIESLTQLGGNPPPRFLDEEEIAQLIYQMADPIRNTRFPMSGRILERVQRVITT